MAYLFSSLTIGEVTFRNRLMMSPMCMYVAGEDGLVTEWHKVHYGARAVGGVGLIMLEATAVEPRGRISPRDLGAWDDAQVDPLADLVTFLQEQGAGVGVQLAHAGRKAWSESRGKGPVQPIAPSPIPFDEGWVTPEEMTQKEIETVVEAFRAAAGRMLEAGVDVVEIHAAHGYLIHEFLSPLSNRREDAYGGSAENRRRFLLEVLDAVRSVWPAERPLFVRVSATDWAQAGLAIEDTVTLARALKEHGVDLVDCSTGGIVPEGVPQTYPGYQVPFAEQVRQEADVRTAAVGLITKPQQAEDILAKGEADVVAMGRELLRHPYWMLDAAGALDVDFLWPRPYWRARPPQEV
jgi:2,4-dienoyl-CoA reductase-like NADH-dependent reductase (Old Yellow Enzyme family)